MSDRSGGSHDSFRVNEMSIVEYAEEAELKYQWLTYPTSIYDHIYLSH